MNPKYCRYSSAMRSSLGYSVDFSNVRHLRTSSLVASSRASELFSYGNFKGIILELFSDSRTPEFDNLLTQNSSPEVVNFVNNFLFKEIQTLPPAVSDEEAFATIIPRSVSTDAELAPYLDKLRGVISEARSRLNSASNETSSPSE